MSKKLTLLQVLTYGILLLFLIIVVYPMMWLVFSSLKTDRDIFLDPFGLPKWRTLQWENYSGAWINSGIGKYFVNSVWVTAATLFFTLLLSSMSAYALSRFLFPGVRPLLFFFLAGLMIPGQLSIVPLFFQMKELHLLNSRFGLVLVYVASSLPFAVFIMTGFFKTLPHSLYESALMDGAGEMRAFASVMLPLSRPGLMTVAIFTFLGIWNEFFMAFMFLSGEGADTTRTLPLALANVTIVSQYSSDWGVAFAALVLVMMPTLFVYVFLQRHLTKGITVGAMKG